MHLIPLGELVDDVAKYKKMFPDLFRASNTFDELYLHDRRSINNDNHDDADTNDAANQPSTTNNNDDNEESSDSIDNKDDEEVDIHSR